MRTERASLFGAACLLVLGVVGGCELIASADRDKIPADGTGGTTPTTTSTASTGSSGGAGTTGGSAGMGGTGNEGGGGMGGTGGAGGMGGGGMGGAMGCMVPGDCGQPTDCATPTCTNMVCGNDFAPANTPIMMQTAMDCQVVVCDGAGAEQPANDDADTEDDGAQCTIDACSSGMATHFPEAILTVCNQAGGKVCDGAGLCVDCVGPVECASSVCLMNVCQAATCTDQVENGAETDTDCGGGTCQACPTGDDCLVGGDCASGSCVTNICQLASCADGVKNGGETDQDCGGPDCGDCATGDDCLAGGDCTSGVCSGAPLTCQAPTCSDTVQNGSETDIDCGGASCPDCDNGELCATGADCTSGVCSGSPATCQLPTCLDGVENAAETDVDCGGPTCSDCPNGLGCSAGGDCISGVCSGNVCQAASCLDLVENGSETDIDCGGPTCADCANGKMCLAGGDCVSGVCTGNVCQVPTCSDLVKNGTETDIDCGGASCADCANGKACLVAGDCVSMVCSGNPLICQTPTCMDSVENGAETDVDCGGATCAGCAGGQDCLVHADCAGGACNPNNTNCAPTCNDAQAPGATCASYCACMEGPPSATCGATFPSVAACLDACAVLSVANLCCRAYHCGAAMGDPVTHCPHASGLAICQ